jgi:hypothetical protein
MKDSMSNEYWIGVEKEAQERLEALKIMLDSLDVQRAERANEILQLEQLLRSIAPFTTDDPLDAAEKICNNFGLVSSLEGLDLAEACRKVLKENDRYMSPREIRDMLEVNDYDLTQHPNHLASIHGVLKRLAESGDVLRMADSRGVIYKWNTSDFKRSPLRWIGQRGTRKSINDQLIEEGKGRDDPAWQKHMRGTGGLKLTNPPYAKQNQSLSVREAKEARQTQEAIEQAEIRKRKREFEAKKKGVTK